jgi:hypothetical protein
MLQCDVVGKVSAPTREYLRQLGAKGGKAAAGKGARVRFENITADERSKLAKKAAAARWKKAR